MNLLRTMGVAIIGLSKMTWFFKLNEEEDPRAKHYGLAASLPPDNIRRKVEIGYNPDPSIISFVLCREYLKYFDPRLFVKSTVKQMLEESRTINLNWRNSALSNLCKNHNIDPSLIASPPEMAKEPIFNHVGPTISWHTRCAQVSIDMLSIVLLSSLFVFLFAFIVFILGLPFWTLSLGEKLTIFIGGCLYIVTVIMILNYLVCQIEINQAKTEPKVFLAYGRLKLLFKDLKEDLQVQLAKDLPMTITSINKARPHRDKKAYSIKIESEFVFNPRSLFTLSKSRKLQLHIEIIGQNLNGPAIVVYWFEQPGIVLGTDSTLKTIDLIKHHMSRLCQHIQDDTELRWTRNALFNKCEDKDYINSRLNILAKYGVRVEHNLNN